MLSIIALGIVVLRYTIMTDVIQSRTTTISICFWKADNEDLIAVKN
jgi:hypothetical protein